MGINTIKTNNYFTILGAKEINGDEEIQNEEIQNAYRVKMELINKLKVKNAADLDRTGNQTRYEQAELYIEQLESQVQEAYEQLKTEQGREEYKKRLEGQKDRQVEGRTQAEGKTKKISQINPNKQKKTEIEYIKELQEAQKEKVVEKEQELQYVPIHRGRMGKERKNKELQFIPICKRKMGATPEQRKSSKQQRQVEEEEER